MILSHWSYSKWKDILHTLNIYKNPPKEHQVVEWWAVDEISVVNIVVEIFRVCPPNIMKLQKPKEEKNCRIWNLFFLSVQYVLMTAAQ